MSRDILRRWPKVRRFCWKLATSASKRIPLNATRFLAHCAGVAAYRLDARGRKRVRRNLANLVPRGCDQALDRATRRSYTHFAVATAESLRIGRLPGRFFGAERLEVRDPFGVLRKAPIQGPAILVTVHANWELLAAALHHLGLMREAVTLALGHGDPAIDRVFERLRASVGCESVLIDRGPLAALRALHEGKLLLLAGDRDYAGSGPRVELAGRQMRLPIGPAALAVQTGAPIIPLYLGKRSARRFTLIAGRPLHARPDAPKHEEAPRLTAELGRSLARFLLAAPAQWAAFHPVWDEDRGPDRKRSIQSGRSTTAG